MRCYVKKNRNDPNSEFCVCTLNIPMWWSFSKSAFISLHSLILMTASLSLLDLESIPVFLQSWKFQACPGHCTSSVILGTALFTLVIWRNEVMVEGAQNNGKKVLASQNKQFFSHFISFTRQ